MQPNRASIINLFRFVDPRFSTKEPPYREPWNRTSIQFQCSPRGRLHKYWCECTSSWDFQDRSRIRVPYDPAPRTLLDLACAWCERDRRGAVEDITYSTNCCLHITFFSVPTVYGQDPRSGRPGAGKRGLEVRLTACCGDGSDIWRSLDFCFTLTTQHKFVSENVRLGWFVRFDYN